MTQEQKHYYAFISHSSEDEKTAKWLCKQLEGYHIPAVIQKDYHAPKRLKPIFLFQTDLSGNKLRDALEGELSDSQFLIVLCSPAAAKSDYVNKEVKHFIDSGRYDKIIPFIIKGTPYASKNGDLENECFPQALVDLKGKKQELRGIDLRQEQKDRGSKKAAVIDVIASMLGVRMDVLWDRYKRRVQKIRNFVMALLTLLLLIIIGIYDYTRTKVDYYADWVDCNGIAQGVIPLTKEQYKHRCYSFKFEYSRIPLGEKGFYSWRLNKVSIVNSRGVISNYTLNNHAFFYPIQEYKYSNGYVTEIINRDKYSRVVMRYTIKDDNDHKVACLVDMEAKEKYQGSAFLSGSTTAFLSDVGPTMSKIKRFHYTRNEKGYITKVTYHANDADELDESAIGDNNNIYGKLFELDELGRVSRVTYINHEGNPMTDKYGVGFIRYNNAPFGKNDTTEYLGSDGELAYNEHKFARQVSKQDKYGNPIEQWYDGADGNPCYNYENIYRQVIMFDSKGCLTEMKYYDSDGNLAYSKDNYAILKIKYDSKGRCIEYSNYDTNEKPCYTKECYSIGRVQYDSKDRMIEQSYYDIDNKPCIEQSAGTHKTCIKYDESNYVQEVSFRDEEGNLTISPMNHFAKVSYEYNAYHQLIVVKNYDENGLPCYDDTFVHEYRNSYDHRGNLIKIECLNTEGKPCVCKAGYASITYVYDNYGNKTKESYFGINGEPIYINQYVSYESDYYANGLIKEQRCYDENNNLCIGDMWFAICRFEYDINGHQTRVSYFNTDTLPCYYKNGLYHSFTSDYDGQGNIVKQVYYDMNNQIALTKDGYAIGRYKYDNYHRVTEYAYYDEKDIPCYYDHDYHIIQYEYDSKGDVVQCSILGHDKKLCLSRKGAAIIQYMRDNKGNCTRIEYKDANGNKLNQVCSIVFTYNNKDQLIKSEYLDKNGRQCMYEDISDGHINYYSCVKEEYDSIGHKIKRVFFDTKGAPCRFMPFAYEHLKYDELGRILEKSVFRCGLLLAFNFYSIICFDRKSAKHSFLQFPI